MPHNAPATLSTITYKSHADDFYAMFVPMLLLLRSLSFSLPSITQKRFYRRVMNLHDPQDQRDYVAVADHGLSVLQ